MKIANLPIWTRTAFVIALILLGVDFVVFCFWLLGLLDDAGKWLYDWQTLIAGALALIGALGTVYYLHAQIEQARDLENARKRREENAARAVLPLALNQVVEYAVECIEFLNRLAPAGRNCGVLLVDANVRPPSVAPEAVGTIRECVRFADDEIVQKLSTILIRLQIQQARLRDVLTHAAETTKHLSRVRALSPMVDAAELYAQAAELFKYGRDASDLRLRSPREDIHGAFFQAGIVVADVNDLAEVINRRYPESKRE